MQWIIQFLVGWAYQFGRRFLWLRKGLFWLLWRYKFRGIRGSLPPKGLTTIDDLRKEVPEWLTLPNQESAENGKKSLAERLPQSTHAPCAPCDESVVLIRNGLIWGGGAIITPEKQILRDRSPELGAAQNWHRALMLPCLPRPAQFFPRVTSLSVSANHKNYFHWVMDEFCRLAFVSKYNCGKYFIYNDLPWQREFLKLEGILPSDCVSASIVESIQADSLIVPPLVGYGATDKVRQAVTFLRRLRNRHFPPPSDLIGVYLTRGKSSRKPVNDIAFIDLLVERGIKIVDTGRMTVSEQINTVYGAKLIVGAHGAAMTNMVFASAGARIIELQSQDYKNSFRGLAKACGHEHIMINCPVPAKERWRPKVQRGYWIPISQVIDLIESSKTDPA